MTQISKINGLPYTNTSITGFTYDGINKLTIGNNDGVEFNTSILTLSGTSISATTFYGDGSNLTNLPADTNTFVTGGTYNNPTGTATYTNNTGGTFNVSGFYTGATDGNTFVTGFTNTDNLLTISDNSGSTYSTLFNTVTGLTSTGLISSTTISATTYQNLPIDPDTNTFVTGGTYSSGVATYTNNTGGTFNVSGFYTGATDANTYVTGGTYNGDTLSLTRNDDVDVDVTGITDNFTTGVTVDSGDVFFNRNDSLSAYTITFSGVNINVISDDVNKKITFSAATGGGGGGGTYASYYATPSNPGGTSSGTGVMMGLAGSITPTATGKVVVTVSGEMATSSSLSSAGVILRNIRYGTGTAPTNGATLTGTAMGQQPRMEINHDGFVPFSQTVLITGLSLSTAYWLDIGISDTGSGTASVSDLTVVATEIP